MKLIVGSLFTGIGGFDLGFERAGFFVLWQAEIDAFCRAVLATHFPHAERFTDVCEIGKHNLQPVDVLCAGVPCQDVSVAGKRAGLAGERTGLFYEFARILQELRPRWFVFENVPGLLSSNGGRDFAEILRVLMVECGYGVSWRVLNSQFFGVAQRRRRVFVVGYFGAPCPPQVLFESEGGRGDFEAGGETWPNIAGPLGGGAYGTGRRSEDDPNVVAHAVTGSSVSSGLSTGGGKPGSGYPAVAYALRRDPGGVGQGHNTNFVAATLPADHRFTTDSATDNLQPSPAPDSHGMRAATGLPAGMDSPRYRALGNAVTVQVAEWIAQRIAAYEMEGRR